MSKFPVVSGKEAVRAFERLGYRRIRQKGSHVHMKCEGRSRITVPLNDPVAKGTLASIVRDAGFTTEEFKAAL